MVGTELGHFRVLERLAAGGMGEVYRARDLNLGRDVALKVVPADVARDPDRFRRLRTEAEGGLAIVCDPGEKAALLAAADPAFYTTPHYDGYAMILIDLDTIDEQRLTEMIEDAWLLKAPVRVRKAYEQDNPN